MYYLQIKIIVKINYVKVFFEKIHFEDQSGRVLHG